ncbi:uncharacterized protein LOC143190680 [Rhynchophorus ferrugineus]|uniref:uncharacterized protein LOC143190680 n=1 Tax=Rhynchophorus ferrugineus TaxID=354439 RepID=UPI003FCCF7C8
MCAAVAPALPFVLLVATLSLSMMCGNELTADGLPLPRQERGAEDYDDVLSGNDFLSVFLQTSLHRARKETATETETEESDFFPESIITEPYVRTSREAGDYLEQVPITTERQSNSLNVSDSTSSDGVIIAVHVSTSVGSNSAKPPVTDISEGDIAQKNLDQNFLSYDENHSIVAKSSKSELSVEEPVPITTDNEETSDKPPVKISNLQATLQNLPSSQHITFNPADFKENSDNLPPFHHSFIYHDNPKEPGRARSVSYSTIIQAIPQNNGKNSNTHERKERNYDTGTGYRNSFNPMDAKQKLFNDDTKSDPNVASTTTTQSSTAWEQPLRPTQKTESPDVNSERPYGSSSSPKLPTVYGRPEQNYEVDEAVSVVTNGRAHGVQDDQLLAKKKTEEDKDQKFGYVVEGRNYRKYRVEERTPDGFIVGEYGVVSHDDGSLRGVRYTADGTINPRLIYDALMKFLSL